MRGYRAVAPLRDCVVEQAHSDDVAGKTDLNGFAALPRTLRGIFEPGRLIGRPGFHFAWYKGPVGATFGRPRRVRFKAARFPANSHVLQICRRAGCEARACGILLTARGGRKRPALRRLNKSVRELRATEVYSVVTWYTGVQGHGIQFCGRLKHPKHRGEQDALGAQNCERTKT